MKAMVYRQYGSPDVLKLEDVSTPRPGAGEVLVRVRAASVNAGDWHLMRGKPFLVRLMGYGLARPKFPILGADVAGQVEALGPGVTRCKPGDAVFGAAPDHRLGAFAEFACVPEALLVRKPAQTTFEEAAAVPASAMTALQALRDAGKIRSGQRVLIHGAGGGVGTFAVQIAAALGAEVTAVTRTGKREMVRALGASRIIDYTREDFAATGTRYDLIVDTGAFRPLRDYLRALKPHGTYVVIGGATRRFFQAALLGPWISRFGDKRVTHLISKPDGADLAYLRDLLAAGKLAPVIDLRYPLSELPRAIRHLEEGHASGKVVITL